MRLLPPLLIALVAGCATVVGTLQLDDRFGNPDPVRFDHPTAAVSGAPDYWNEVRPLLDQRCVSCHACYDAPCQLNLASYAGITRGANPAQVYANRLLADPPTRLGFDAQSNAEWRQKGFFPVLNERAQTPEANREGGVMYRMLDLKAAHPGPDGGRLTDRDIDLSLEREQVLHHRRGLRPLRPQAPAARHAFRAAGTRPGRAADAGALAGERRALRAGGRRRRPPRSPASPSGSAS